MITYLIYSTVCMGLLLLFYHVFLEKEKMHHLNRGYLIFSLIFSLAIPLIPVGMTGSILPGLQFEQSQEIQLFPTSLLSEGEGSEIGSEGLIPVTVTSGISLNLFTQLALLIYTLIAGILFVRLLRIIHMIQMKADRNPRKLFDDYEIVLLTEKVVPHTFISTIFLNKDQYLKGEISQEIMLHELTHARQKHTLDILFVEFLKILLWFNPVLYLYKKAILLNHEFLADQAVISGGIRVSEYQTLLLKSLLGQPSHGLISPFNYALTKKRLYMMTQKPSKIRSLVRIVALVPLFATLALFLGCESTPSEYPEQDADTKELNIVISDSEALKINGDEMNLSKFDEYLSGLAETPELVDLSVDSNAIMGVVTDVQKMLRDHGIMRINYSTHKRANDDELNRVTQEYLEAAHEYMKMSVPHTDMQIMEDKYNEVMKLYEAIKEVQIEVPDAPPPPPFPPSPEKRLENDLDGNIELKGNIEIEPEMPEPPPPPVEVRNLLQILVSADGHILINEEPVGMEEIKNRLKQFVDNNGSDPDLSENPQEAIIAIKTDRHTPYEIYTEMLDEVMAGYNELRDAAAQSRFGVSFTTLEENSDRREEIEEMYPKRISIVPPEN